MESAFRSTAGELCERLLAALRSGKPAGSESAPLRSAVLLVVRPSDQYAEYRERYASLRVDDHANPVTELERLYRILEAGDLARAHVRYAESYRHSGQLRDAERELRRVGESLGRALSNPRTEASSLVSLARLACEADLNLDDAQRAADRAASVDPGSTEALDAVAECHFHRGEFTQAIVAARKALTQSPDDPHLKSQLKKFEEGEKKGKPGGARPSSGQPSSGR